MTNGKHPAFPSPDNDWAGLSKREYFAAMAVTGLGADSNLTPENTARFAVKIADLLIEELNKGEGSE